MRVWVVLVVFLVPVGACSLVTSLDDLKGGSDANADNSLVDQASCDGTSCGGTCTDLRSDPKHCGSCSRACHDGDTCFAGACQGDVVDIVSGGATVMHTCATLVSGALYCWGNNVDGELGLADKKNRAQATLVATDSNGNKITNVASVSAGATFSMVLDSSKRLLATGDGTAYEQFGGFQAAYSKLTLLQSNAPYAFVASGTNYACGGTDVACWGINATGQLGHAAGASGDTPCPSDTSLSCNSGPASTGIHALALALGGIADRGTTCALLTDGSVQCWGDDDIGETGSGQVKGPNQAPLQVASFGAGTLTTTGPSVGHSLCVGGYGGCAAKADGTVWCWGLRALGTSSPPDTCTNATPCALSPLQVQGISGATGVTCGGSHACAVTSSGAVWCWGANDVGQLGVGDIASHDGPVQVKNMQTAMIVAAGDAHVCAATTDGQAYCWGQNTNGELGDGDDAGTNSAVPIQVAGLP